MKHTAYFLLILCVASATASAWAKTTPRAGYLPEVVTDKDFYEQGDPSPAKVELGRMLFFDKILSGNKNISCATCHHPEFGSADGIALPFGEGPRGLGPERKALRKKDQAVHGRVPRNSPALFNLGAREFTRLFHDGRVETDPNGYYEGGFITPAKWKLPAGLENVLAAQAMFPVTSPDEMAGHKGENAIADAVALNRAAGPDGAWARLAQRLQAIPRYVELFKAAYPGLVDSAQDITFVRAANAVAAFEAAAFRTDDSPFDRYLRGETQSLSVSARTGMALFYGKAGCSRCHTGKFQTDHDFHAIAMPQIGPGKSDGWNDDYWRTTGLKAFPEDFGRGRVTSRQADRYKFRTPSLRNVALTGPWGHAGAYRLLKDVVRHHLDPVKSLHGYRLSPDHLLPLSDILEITVAGSRLEQSWLNANRKEGFLMRDEWVQRHDELRELIADANELAPKDLTDEEVDMLLAFLESLTDPNAVSLDNEVPLAVPSGLPVKD